MTLKIKEKKIIVKNILYDTKNAISLIVANYDKITSNIMNDLRGKAFEQNIKIKVIQNNLAKIAFKDTLLEKLSNNINGATILLFSNIEIGSPAKLFKEFDKYLKFKIIYVENKIFKINKLKEISQIPKRKKCIIKLNNTIKMPIIKLIKTIKNIPLKIINTINIISKNK